MKKSISVLLALCCIFSAIPFLTLTAVAEEDAITPDISWYDPEATDLYITDAADLLGFSKMLSEQLKNNVALTAATDTEKAFAGKTVHLIADIDLNPDWVAGETAPANVWFNNSYRGFTGMFDGHNHTISGIYLSATVDAHTGIFGNARVFSSETEVGVKNLAIVNSYVKTTKPNFGGLFGSVPAVSGDPTGQVAVENVYLDVDMVSTYTNGDLPNDLNTAGVIGFVAAGQKVSIKNIVVNSRITCGRARPIAGFVARVTGTVLVEDSLFSGCIKSTSNRNSGFIGHVNSTGATTITHCMENGDVYPSTATTDLNATASFIAVIDNATAEKNVVNNSIYTGVSKYDQATSVFINGKAPIGIYSFVNQNRGIVNDLLYCENGEGLAGFDAQEKLDEAGMVNWTVTVNGCPLPRALVVSKLIPLSKKDVAEQPVTTVCGYQTTKITDGKFDMRLVVTLKLPDGKTLSDFTAVGLKIVANYDNVTKMKEFNTKTVYYSVAGYTEGENQLETYTAQALGGDYVFALACKGLPVVTDGIVMEVTPFYQSQGQTVFGGTAFFTVITPKNTISD